MLNEAQTLMASRRSSRSFPGFAIVITVLGLNLLGDGLRDLLDPRLRREPLMALLEIEGLRRSSIGAVPILHGMST